MPENSYSQKPGAIRESGLINNTIITNRNKTVLTYTK